MSMDETGGHSPIANCQHGMVPTKRRIAATLAEESMGQIKQIVEFWTKCDLKNPPFVHPDDRAVLFQYSESKPDLPTYDFRRFVLSPRFGAFSDPRLHFSLLPVPYAGDLARADIFVLQLNPGLNFIDYYAEWCMPEFRQRLESNLRQRLTKVEFPFLYLDPQFCWHSGFRWWEGKFREVATAIADAKFGGRYLHALRDLSQRVAALELVPYHSISFREHLALPHLASAKRTRLFACELAKKAATGKVTMIITRRLEDWAIPKSRNVIQYTGGLRRGASLGIETPGGQAILARYGLQVKNEGPET